MSLSVGLTGGIGMGKSTTAKMFVDQGAQLWDADAAVNRLYAKGQAGSRAIAAAFPDAITDNAVDRAKLRAMVQADPAMLSRLEGLIHPLLVEDRRRFRHAHPEDVLIFDIPLLFETGLDAEMDITVAVSTDAATQRERVMARPGMSEALFARVTARQLTDAERRAKADHIIATDDLDTAHAEVASLMAEFRAKQDRGQHA